MCVYISYSDYEIFMISWDTYILQSVCIFPMSISYSLPYGLLSSLGFYWTLSSRVEVHLGEVGLLYSNLSAQLEQEWLTFVRIVKQKPEAEHKVKDFNKLPKDLPKKPPKNRFGGPPNTDMKWISMGSPLNWAVPLHWTLSPSLPQLYLPTCSGTSWSLWTQGLTAEASIPCLLHLRNANVLRPIWISTSSMKTSQKHSGSSLIHFVLFYIF